MLLMRSMAERARDRGAARETVQKITSIPVPVKRQASYPPPKDTGGSRDTRAHTNTRKTQTNRYGGLVCVPAPPPGVFEPMNRYGKGTGASCYTDRHSNARMLESQ